MQVDRDQNTSQLNQNWHAEFAATEPADDNVTRVMIVSASEGTAGAFVAHELEAACPHWDLCQVVGTARVVAAIARRPFSCALVVAGPGQENDLDLVLQIHRHSSAGAIPVVVVSDSADAEFVLRARQAGVASVIPWSALNSSYLELAITGALGQWRLMRVIDLLNQQVEEKQERRGVQRQRAERFAHELLTPLASVQEFISLVFDEVAGPINAEQASHLAFARGACSTIEASIEALVISAGNLEMHAASGQPANDRFPDIPSVAATLQSAKS